ncbi:MAG: histidinol-phosphatase [Phycisphaeraceae bacterium]|nr:histidinol-phosphatase [Phycisphaeraceae bacterium]
MPFFSFHGGHSSDYCRHAYSRLGAMVQHAHEIGFTHLGLSEHAPRFRQQDLYADEEGLTPADLMAMFDAYRRRAFELQREYRGKLEILVGFETEVMPPNDGLSRMAELFRGGGFNYLVGSVHSVGDHWLDYTPQHTAAAAKDLGGVEALQLAYFQQVARLVETLRPHVVGHLDLIRKFDGPNPTFTPQVWRAIDATLEVIATHAGVLDVNAAPSRRNTGPVYPLPEILTRARRMGIRVTLGDDSHSVDDVGNGLSASLAAIAQAGYTSVSYITLENNQPIWHDAPIDTVRPTRR